MDGPQGIIDTDVCCEESGFKPQKEIVFNKLLPFAKELEEDATRLLSDIKANIGKSVLLRELRPGCGIWTARLSKYIKVYGLKFSKEDHIAFIHLMYELTTIPSLEPWLVSKFANVSICLLKKKELLSPDELQLPWKPLFELCERIMNTSLTAIGMYRYFSSLENTLKNLVHAARFYFPPEATQEMLDAWRPRLCPFDGVNIENNIEFLEWFLPIALPPEKSHLGYKLWFEELMNLWKVCHNAPMWENEIMWLMARLAHHNIGYIDWEPYIPLMFTRFLQSLYLPVSYKQVQQTRLHKIEAAPMALWIVAVLGRHSSAQKHLDRLMKTLESYFHPANFGRWFIKLKDFLKKLPMYFIQRLHFERHKHLTWETPVPDSHKLTEDDITNFVESVKPVALQAMFSKLGLTEINQAMQHLATLRPNIVIPLVVDRMYANLETVTEPHKLTAAMQCMVAVARPMVQGARLGYKEGPTHVIPLLMSVLPGIDPNDVRKCFVTFQFIATFSTLIPIVDSSQASNYWSDLTEEEETVCLATADFEDFVLQFLDRCFTLIDSSSLEVTRLERENDRRSKLENMAECALGSTVTTLLMQTSPSIFKSALRKLHALVIGRIMETKVAGQFVAAIVRSFSKVNAEETLKSLVPQFCSRILILTENDEILKDETLDDELLYNLLILSEIVDCDGKCLIPYIPSILEVLDRTLHLTCRDGYVFSSKILRNVLYSLSFIMPLEYRSSTESYDSHVKDYLPIRDWGKPGNVHNLQMKWHVPDEEEIKHVQDIVNRYLPVELERISSYINDKSQMTREELQCSLHIVNGILGCRPLLPQWDEPPVKLFDSCLKTSPFKLAAECNKGYVTMPDGTNVRKVLAKTMVQLQQKILACTEDDTKSLFCLITIWDSIIRVSNTRSNFDAHWKNFHVVKKLLEDKLVGQKRHMRAVLVDRAYLQYESLQERSTVCLTETHSLIMLSLLTLSTSHYSEVRSRAQQTLFTALDTFSYSYLVLVPKLLEYLKEDSKEHHDQFKGALYVLLGPKQNPLVTRHDWTMLNSLWPAIVLAKPSEKASVINLLDNLVETVHKHFPTITINLEIPDTCLASARKLWNSSPLPSVDPISDTEVELGLQKLHENSKYNLEQYLSLLNALMDALEQGNLHWRYHIMALSFVRDLVHPDLAYPPRVVKYFLNTLIHDSLEVRKIAIRGTVFLLKQQKRPHKKIVIDPRSFLKDGIKLESKIIPGERDDNAWVQYNGSTRPLTAEEWDKPRYVHDMYHGYYSWPKELQVYAPSSDQPSLSRSHEELSDGEKEVDIFFSSQGNIDKLVKYLALEEKKGKDKFNGYRFIMFKGLFRNHGDAYLRYFSHHLEELVADKNESSQRCAAEIIAGIIRGSKHWPFEKVSSVWKFLSPVIETALSNMTEETVGDWGVCFATASECRDPNRHHWLLELLMKDPFRDEASFIQCGRLYALQGALNQQEWRVSELFHRLMEYFKPFLTHPFQNVRDRLGSVISNILETDIVFPDGPRTKSPHISDFVDSILPQLEILHQTSEKTNSPAKNHVVQKGVAKSIENVKSEAAIEEAMKLLKSIDVSSDEKDVAIRLLKTVCRWLTGSLTRAVYGGVPEFFKFFHIVCLMENYDVDEELCKCCTSLLGMLAQTTTLPEYIPPAMESISMASKSNSWQVRSTCVEFMQVFVFHNMPTILGNKCWADNVKEIVLRLLEDEWLDVRVKASQVLSGLLHCDFIDSTMELMDMFKLKAKTNLPRKKKNLAPDSKSQELLRLRHSGILGLCAFVSAYPYDVPDFVPDVFLILGEHLNDPQPIPATIRKTLGDFKRTHHDNWQIHSLKFSEEQLEVLGDLTVPPSYYA
ncbi:proteasome activator complex subunit 4-like [Schistocerca gregaria]|uniref:proteasome activator complex subunit 4-like n=1 Tax=Schistocerca gregaria TaxID=7010 RepID=UPI00211F032A|nr:proteasome activator complex subunit 4-like [Schistocerca gregaria]